MQTPFNLNGKTVLITGASSGISRHAAIDCAAMGANMILNAKNEDRLHQTYIQLNGSGHQTILCDLLNESAITSLVKNAPPLDCAVKPFPIQFLTHQKNDETVQTYFSTTVSLTSALLKAKKKYNRASFVFLSTISGQCPTKDNSLYAASKAAIETFAKTVTAEYAHKKIRANCISPAMVKTELYEYIPGGEFKAVMDKNVVQYPLDIGYPQYVANTVVFLLSQAWRWITCVNIIMDGGFIFSH